VPSRFSLQPFLLLPLSSPFVRLRVDPHRRRYYKRCTPLGNVLFFALVTSMAAIRANYEQAGTRVKLLN
jgi:hypothetical protein